MTTKIKELKYAMKQLNIESINDDIYKFIATKYFLISPYQILLLKDKEVEKVQEEIINKLKYKPILYSTLMLLGVKELESFSKCLEKNPSNINEFFENLNKKSVIYIMEEMDKKDLSYLNEATAIYTILKEKQQELLYGYKIIKERVK